MTNINQIPTSLCNLLFANAASIILIPLAPSHNHPTNKFHWRASPTIIIDISWDFGHLWTTWTGDNKHNGTNRCVLVSKGRTGGQPWRTKLWPSIDHSLERTLLGKKYRMERPIPQMAKYLQKRGLKSKLVQLQARCGYLVTSMKWPSDARFKDKSWRKTDPQSPSMVPISWLEGSLCRDDHCRDDEVDELQGPTQPKIKIRSNITFPMMLPMFPSKWLLKLQWSQVWVVRADTFSKPQTQTKSLRASSRFVGPSLGTASWAASGSFSSALRVLRWGSCFTRGPAYVEIAKR